MGQQPQRRILFVDDEPRVLEGLSRMLRPHRQVWDMQFAVGGESALQQMASQPFDVIVTDMRMPGIDGAELLARVQTNYPGTVRIVLSGHTEQDASMRALPVAHRFLSKPCDAALLLETVQRSCDLQSLFHRPELRAKVAQIDTLPVAPMVYQQLSAALARADTSIDDVTAIVEKDSALCAKILQVVNSAFFGLARNVSSIRESVAYLGLEMIRSLSITLGVFRQLDDATLPEGFSLLDEQHHAVGTGRLAAKLVPKGAANDAFVAGMLHDLGKLILAAEMPDDYRRVKAAAVAGGKAFHEVEAEVLGWSHAEIGAYLLGLWGLPHDVVEAVANHHRPSAVHTARFDLVGAVHVADTLQRGSHEALDHPYLERVGCAGEVEAWRALAADSVAAE